MDGEIVSGATNRPTRHAMPLSDQLVEQFYDLVNAIADERARLEVARIAYLAAQHRAAQLTKRRPRA